MEESLERYNWGKLNRMQLGRYAEYFVKMEFTMFGFDVYSSEVDDKGIDFVARKHNFAGDAWYYDIQVKSTLNLNYVFMRKSKFMLTDNLYLALVLFAAGSAPDVYLIPSKRWNTPDSLFADRPYINLKSPPECGLNLTKSKLPLLEPFRLVTMLPKL
ncbi:MAG: DUF4365 domain-containing protein [Chloroflexota bacterium]|nr:DUF4365 domain-containing protein [Chloroflexota bacterium]MDQ5867934.1 DUF4365 domain-containing protein [Chloroflexota bacterium]